MDGRDDGSFSEDLHRSIADVRSGLLHGARFSLFQGADVRSKFLDLAQSIWWLASRWLGPLERFAALSDLGPTLWPSPLSRLVLPYQ